MVYQSKKQRNKKKNQHVHNIILLTENEDGPHSSSSLMASINEADEYCGSISDSVDTEVSKVMSSSSSVPSLPVATLQIIVLLIDKFIINNCNNRRLNISGNLCSV